MFRQFTVKVITGITALVATVIIAAAGGTSYAEQHAATAPTLTLATHTTATPAEDDTTWDCATMGNRTCGPVASNSQDAGLPFVFGQGARDRWAGWWYEPVWNPATGSAFDVHDGGDY